MNDIYVSAGTPESSTTERGSRGRVPSPAKFITRQVASNDSSRSIIHEPFLPLTTTPRDATQQQSSANIVDRFSTSSHHGQPCSRLGHTIRAILTALCDDKSVRAKALRYLKALEPEAESSAKAAATSQPNPKKRKPSPTLSICVQCGDTFSGTSDERCKYHPGECVSTLRLLQPNPLI